MTALQTQPDTNKAATAELQARLDKAQSDLIALQKLPTQKK